LDSFVLNFKGGDSSMKNLPFKNDLKNDGNSEVRNTQKEGSGFRYILWLFIAVLVISVFSLVTTVYSGNNSFALLIDSINSSGTVYFDFGKSELKPKAYEMLDKIAAEMKEGGSTILYITGYTDDRGSEGFNEVLSIARANAVKDYLITNGVPPEDLIVSGKGKNEPVNNNSTEEDRAMNRRVVFSFSNPFKNNGNYAVDKFPGNRFYAEPTLKNDRANSMFKVVSREEITADLSIRDSAGQPVDSLRSEDISATLLWDNSGVVDSTEGQPRLIPINDKKKVAFTLTMDYSGSMYGDDTGNRKLESSEKVKAMESSVKLFIDMLGNNMFCKIVKFGSDVAPSLKYTKSKSVLYTELEKNSNPMGGTALYKSIYASLRDTTYNSNPTVMKTVVAFTDGMENSSGNITLDSIYRRSNATNTKIFTVGLFSDVGNYRPSPVELNRRKADMLSIAQNSGGFFYLANSAGELKEIYANILEQVLKSYFISIVWNSSKLPPKGTLVKAELKINVKGVVRILYKSYVME